METLAQLGIAGAALIVVLRFVLPSMVKTTMNVWAGQMTTQQKMHAEQIAAMNQRHAEEMAAQHKMQMQENAAIRTIFLDALDKQQTVFRETLTEERRDCAARHAEVMEGIESLHGKIDRISPMPLGK